MILKDLRIDLLAHLIDNFLVHCIVSMYFKSRNLYYLFLELFIIFV